MKTKSVRNSKNNKKKKGLRKLHDEANKQKQTETDA